ncbi:MAG: PIG-L family deacetylase [Thermoplasmata archaeon YP2-bin.285]|uniref:PIG-L family deacetylase n=1 Tax=Candidatus Sysuiplasma superficiale TaxID=2823368 RepID=A0A8J7YRP2_9ARCH|nr:PIG-L family deacetylase [Candidatus Sysuiplasma superficiale]
MKTVLVVEPHPDDTAIMAGGTVAKLTAEGSRVIIVTVTDGERGTMDRNIKSADDLRKITRTEASRASEILGVEQQIFLGYLNHDVMFEKELELKNRIMGLIRKFKPHIVMTYDPYGKYEPNPDHRTVSFATYDAATFSHYHLECPEQIEKEGLDTHIVDEVWFYNSPGPNASFDVTDYLPKKVEAMSAYSSQLDSMIEEVRQRLHSAGYRAKFLESGSKKEKILNLWVYPSLSGGRLVEKFRIIRPFITERVGYLLSSNLVEPAV